MKRTDGNSVRTLQEIRPGTKTLETVVDSYERTVTLAEACNVTDHVVSLKVAKIKQ